jgi:hypothetical protein
MPKSGRSTAERFTKCFDKDWTLNRSTLRGRLSDDRSYDASHSWDALSGAPAAFSRLQETALPVQETRPITLINNRVLSLENETDGLKILNGFQPDSQLNEIPRTQAQVDVGMARDLSCKIPLKDQAVADGKAVLVESNQRFFNYHMEGPQLTVVAAPEVLSRAGPQCDKIIMTPAQRREVQEFEKKKKFADNFISEAGKARGKTLKLVNGMDFKRGIVGVDSALNETSEIYGQRAQEYNNEVARKVVGHAKRREHLGHLTSTQSAVGNILVPRSVKETRAFVKEYQGKGMTHTSLGFDGTYNRLFPAVVSKRNHRRVQELRDQDINGKEYNLVTHARIVNFPPSTSERVDKRMSHPSQESLLSSRNLQGALCPY